MFAKFDSSRALCVASRDNVLLSLAAVLGLIGAAYGRDQSQTASQQEPTDPSSASSPHQQETTSTAPSDVPTTSSPEATSAATPHQHEVLKGSEGSTGKGISATQFVQDAAQDGMTEVALGKAAAKKSTSAAVKAFGERMVTDHGKANAELAAIAQRQNLSVPKELDAKHRAMVEELSGKSGAAFDASYVQHMAGDHAKAIALFTEASKLSDADLAGFAKKTLPTLQEHKKMADELARTRTATAPSESR